MAKPLFLGFKVASDMGHAVVDEGHLYLELMDGRPDPVAAEVLGALGLRAAALRSAVEVRGARAARHAETLPDDARHTSASPLIYGIEGRVEAFAAALGDGTPRSTDVLLALLWTDVPPWYLEEQGVTREQVLDALRERGIDQPKAAPPEVIRKNMSQRIELPKERLNAAIRILRERHPPGRHPYWGVNTRDDLGWIIAEDGIDLEAIVAEAAASAG